MAEEAGAVAGTTLRVFDAPDGGDRADAWLDTVVFIGSIGASKPAAQQLAFAAGTMLASLLWFVALAWGSRRMGWLFRSAWAWRLLDAAIALLMAYLALQLLAGA